MTASAVAPSSATRSRLEAAWARSDSLFALLDETALLERPIRLRQPFLFYLGHLPAFAWNHLGRGAPSVRPDFDALFARGIDPPDTSNGPDDSAAWPPPAEVLAYRDRIRRALEPRLEDAALEKTALLALEHELMHHETLLYMLLRLDHARKRPPTVGRDTGDGRPPDVARRAAIPAGRARLGAERGEIPFGWDNEFPSLEVPVDAFSIDATPVRNRDLLAFVEATGYGDRRLWSDESWEWLKKGSRRLPPFWQEGDTLTVRGVFADTPLAQALDWPAFVTHSEATAYARWQGKRLPTEPEYHRAAYGAPDGGARRFPWGDAVPSGVHGNFGLRHWGPLPVGSFPAGASGWGVRDLAGNAWEWTSSAFAPFPGFEPLPTYPGYSADFFDGRHFVLKGASWATEDGLVRRSFRNWFQPHYPYVFAQFRLVG